MRSARARVRRASRRQRCIPRDEHPRTAYADLDEELRWDACVDVDITMMMASATPLRLGPCACIHVDGVRKRATRELLEKAQDTSCLLPSRLRIRLVALVLLKAKSRPQDFTVALGVPTAIMKISMTSSLKYGSTIARLVLAS